MSDYVQEPPNAVQIELVEGCNLRCPFCGLNGIREPKVNNLKFMKVSLLAAFAEQMRRYKWTSRIEFAMHGEPTLHPEVVDAVRVVRDVLPKASIMMTSNGGGLLRAPGPAALLKQLFEAGLNVFALDCYEYVNIHTKVRESVAQSPAGQFTVHEYPAEADASPHARRKPKEHALVYVQDISKAEAGTHASLNNHAGAGAPPTKDAHGKRCAKPFREMSVRWDGGVAVCCNDWRGVYKVGNVFEMDLHRLWTGPEFTAARRYLIRGDRHALRPCDGCDALSYRVGLLPDKLGKASLPTPTSRDKDIVLKATRGKPFTLPVLRPWEEKP